MEPDFDPGQFFTRADARSWGMDDRAVTRAIASGWWHRLRRGYYVSAEAWRHLDDVQRHRVRARAVMHSLGDAVVLSHVSAVLEHGIATWALPLDRVHVTRLDSGAGRTERDVVHHEGLSNHKDVMRVEGIQVMQPARSALEAGTLTSPEKALVVLDSTLHLARATAEELREQFERMRHWPHKQRLHVPVRMADGRAESPGESRARWLFHRGGIPAPISQFEVRSADGRLLGTTDWGWPEHRLLGEFDGRIKYGRLLGPGQDPGDAVFVEKQREDRLREATGFGMVRLVWSDLDTPSQTLERIRRQLGRTAA